MAPWTSSYGYIGGGRHKHNDRQQPAIRIYWINKNNVTFPWILPMDSPTWTLLPGSSLDLTPQTSPKSTWPTPQDLPSQDQNPRTCPPDPRRSNPARTPDLNHPRRPNRPRRRRHKSRRLEQSPKRERCTHVHASLRTRLLVGQHRNGVSFSSNALRSILRTGV